jgi:hypothetical protein
MFSVESKDTICPQIDSEIRDNFVRHVGQHIDFIEQPQMKEQVHNNLKNRLQEIGLSEM